MDSANDWQIFFNITLPSLKPIIIFSSILLTGTVFQLFSEVMIISKGGPLNSTITLAYYIYRLSFEYTPQFGYASAIAVLLLAISLIFSIAQSFFWNKKHEKIN